MVVCAVPVPVDLCSSDNLCSSRPVGLSGPEDLSGPVPVPVDLSGPEDLSGVIFYVVPFLFNSNMEAAKALSCEDTRCISSTWDIICGIGV